MRQGKASVKVLKAWVPSNGNGLADPVTGSTANALKFTTAPSSLDSITDAGAQRISSWSAFSLSRKSSSVLTWWLQQKRTSDGVVCYEFDLALPAKDVYRGACNSMPAVACRASQRLCARWSAACGAC